MSERALTLDDLQGLGFTPSKFWEGVTDTPHLETNPDAESVVRITESHTEQYRWYVEIETWGNAHRWSGKGHINTQSELARLYEFCEMKQH